MAKLVALVVSALCVLALANLAQCHDQAEDFQVEGRVYCDTCRVLFPTKVSTWLPGAKLQLQCRNRDTGNVTVTVSGTSDGTGYYNLKVSGEHENEICEVTAISSPHPECNEPAVEISVGKISLTSNSGIKSRQRYCNPIGFLKKHSLPSCPDVLDQIGLKFAPSY
ncbi:hypothetical protein U1Q18_024275 [Sarracenia purpurea var. burkii]